MKTERLTDAWVTSMERVARKDAANLEITTVVPEAMLSLLSELRERRQAELTEADRLALVRAREYLPEHTTVCASKDWKVRGPCDCELPAAFSVLDRLTGRSGT